MYLTTGSSCAVPPPQSADRVISMLLGLLNIESSQERWLGSFEDREPRERERQTDRERETHRERDTHTQRQADRERERLR